MMNKAILSSSMGNIIEWYDFGIYSSFAMIFSHLFFPDDNPNIAIIKVFGIFALGFVCRPLGALIFGHCGDKQGRARTLQKTILWISIPTLLTAFIPTYQHIGVMAPILLIILRIFQGISLGGEYTGNISYLLEIAPVNHRALVVSFAPMAANIGIILGTLVCLILQHLSSNIFFISYGWRIAFIIGAIFSIIVLYLRKGFSESEVFQQIKKNHKILKNPVGDLFKKNPNLILRSVGLVALNAVFYYMCFIYFQNYLVAYGRVSKEFALILFSACIGVMFFLVPVCGYVCDKIGRRNSYLLVTIGVISFSSIGFKLLLSGKVDYIIFSMIVFTLLSSLEQATSSVTLAEQFPATIRYTGVSLSYNITQAILGGTAPLFASLSIHIFGSVLAPAFYLAIIASITLLTAFFSLKEAVGSTALNHQT